MVRGPAALLALPVAAFAYFVAAPLLPGLPAGRPAVLAAGIAGLLAAAAAALALLPARETVTGPLLVLGGAGVVAAALNVVETGAAANIPESFVGAALGLVLARALGTPAVALAVPVFVALIDVAGALGTSAVPAPEVGSGGGEPLSLLLPGWGGAGPAGRLALGDVVFLAMFAAWAWRFGVRRAATVAGLVAGMVSALVLEALGIAAPSLALLGAGYLLTNADRLIVLLGEQERG
ncbi:MAG TPA: hypothetical protein VGV40_10930 [Solirubrobacteraceae bacterium]|nr:hypothetical protein [Solirubrobacteraceae bacterium]